MPAAAAGESLRGAICRGFSLLATERSFTQCGRRWRSVYKGPTGARKELLTQISIRLEFIRYNPSADYALFDWR